MEFNVIQEKLQEMGEELADVNILVAEDKWDPSFLNQPLLLNLSLNPNYIYHLIPIMLMENGHIGEAGLANVRANISVNLTAAEDNGYL
jgi:hypothetical protein